MAQEYKKLATYIDHLYTLDYKEKPVDVITFLKDEYYLGKTTKKLSAIYPGWVPIIKEVATHDDRYVIIVTGSIGTGKTFVICGLLFPFFLYKISLLKDPWQFFAKAESGKFEVVFFNLTKSLSGCRGFSYMQTAIQASPWFIEHGGVIRGNQDKVMELPLFNWALASPYAKGFGFVGGNTILGILSEVDSQNESEGQKKRVLDAYNAAFRRFESRFVTNSTSLGRLFLDSSKQDELSFLEAYIEEHKHSNRVRVYDKAQWEIKPASDYCGEKFAIMVGDQYTSPRIIEESEREKCLKDGFKVIDVPIELKDDFEADLVGSLRDLAGIAVRGIRRYKLFGAERFIKECIDVNKEDPCPIIHETGLNDTEPWIKRIDLSKIRVDFSTPRFIHLDISFSGDAMSLASSCVAGWVEVDVQDDVGSFTRKPVAIIETDFVYTTRARANDRIDLSAMRRFVLDLRQAGLNIRKFTADLLLASEDTLQILKKAKIDASYFSVDKDVKAYFDFRNLVFEHRWVCHFRPKLFFELKNLEVNKDRNLVDHPDKVMDLEFLDNGGFREVVVEGSKDDSDAVCASVEQALLNASVPINKREVKDAIAGMREAAKPEGLPADWFISEKSKAGLPASVVTAEQEKLNNMKEAIKRFRNNR